MDWSICGEQDWFHRPQGTTKSVENNLTFRCEPYRDIMQKEAGEVAAAIEAERRRTIQVYRDQQRQEQKQEEKEGRQRPTRDQNHDQERGATTNQKNDNDSDKDKYNEEWELELDEHYVPPPPTMANFCLSPDYQRTIHWNGTKGRVPQTGPIWMPPSDAKDAKKKVGKGKSRPSKKGKKKGDAYEVETAGTTDGREGSLSTELDEDLEVELRMESRLLREDSMESCLSYIPDEDEDQRGEMKAPSEKGKKGKTGRGCLCLTGAAGVKEP